MGRMTCMDFDFAFSLRCLCEDENCVGCVFCLFFFLKTFLPRLVVVRDVNLPLISDHVRKPAEFKHINKRRKRN